MTVARQSLGSPVAALDWVRRHLLRTWYDALITLAFSAVFIWVLTGVVRFLTTIDYTILRVNLALFMLGGFPRSQIWRPAVGLLVLALALGGATGALASHQRDTAVATGQPYRRSRPIEVAGRIWPVLALVVVLLALTSSPGPVAVALGAAALFGGGNLFGRRLSPVGRRWAWGFLGAAPVIVYLILAGFGGVGWGGWGGLHLNLFLTVAGIMLAFPLGLLLALGRRSSFPAVRTVAVAYIEFIRGVPLISLLLMGVFALGFFLPSNLRPGDVTRVLIAITLFESAYIAEVVRGGLQAVPRGQIEASQALGMAPWKTMRLVVLPQALRATIPAMVGQFISLYKDTTLVGVVNFPDVLNVAGGVNTQPDFLAQGLERLTLPFAGLIFWVGSFTMSREARRLERRLGVGER
jgi:general L-amino acid transport system permease protein